MTKKHPTRIKQQIEKIAVHLITKSDVDVISVIKLGIGMNLYQTILHMRLSLNPHSIGSHYPELN